MKIILVVLLAAAAPLTAQDAEAVKKARVAALAKIAEEKELEIIRSYKEGYLAIPFFRTVVGDARTAIGGGGKAIAGGVQYANIAYLITGYPAKDLPDKATLKGRFAEDGVFKYKAPAGDEKTVKRLVYVGPTKAN